MLEKQKNSQSKEANCFHCQKLIIIKYVHGSQRHSQKNNWGHWTENLDYKTFSICDDCLAKLYYQHKWEFSRIIPKKKQVQMRNYINSGIINGKPEMVFIINKSNLSKDDLDSLQKKKKKNKNEEAPPH